ncbi:unnamed protein product, partial [marine sediment metagenome]
MYYGKGDATTTSSGDNTFLFFDDFSGAMDWGKWASNEHTKYVTTGGLLRCARPTANTGFIRTANTFSEQVRIRYAKKTSSSSTMLYSYYSDGPDTYAQLNAALTDFWRPDSATRYTKLGYTKDDDTSYSQVYSDNVVNTWRKVFKTQYDNKVYTRITDLAGSTVEEITEKTDAKHGYDRYLKFLQWVSGYAYIDNVRIGKYVDPEPTHTSWGLAEAFQDLP